VLGHIAERDRPPIKARMRWAWRENDYCRALEQLTRLADELEHTHPGAAGSLREGMEETLTVIRFGIKGKLRRTLEPCAERIAPNPDQQRQSRRRRLQPPLKARRLLHETDVSARQQPATHGSARVQQPTSCSRWVPG
jgi:hypothetical protein